MTLSAFMQVSSAYVHRPFPLIFTPQAFLFSEVSQRVSAGDVTHDWTKVCVLYKLSVTSFWGSNMFWGSNAQHGDYS